MNSINALKKELYDLVVIEHKKDKKSSKTKILLNYYNKVLPLNKLEEIIIVFKELKNNINSITVKYNKLLTEYNKSKDKKTYDELLTLKAEYDSLLVIHNIFNKYVVTSKKVTKKAPEVNSDLDRYFEISKQIIVLKNECFRLEYSDLKAAELRKQIYDLCLEREGIVDKILGTEGVNYLRSIESSEDRILSQKDELDGWVLLSDNFEEMKDDTILTTPEYIDILRKTLRELSGVEFDIESTMEGVRKKKGSIISTNKLRAEEYKEIVRKNYYNLIRSVNNPLINDIANDLLKYLSIYNIEGGYSVFKKHHPDGKIGNEAISIDLYKSGIKKIEELISHLVKLTQKEINKNGGEIKITNHVPTKIDGIRKIGVMNVNLINQMSKVLKERKM